MIQKVKKVGSPAKVSSGKRNPFSDPEFRKECLRKAQEARKLGLVSTRTPSPLRAIRLKCVDCCAGSKKEVERCRTKDCSLWIWRFGKRAKTMEKRGKGNLINVNAKTPGLAKKPKVKK